MAALDRHRAKLLLDLHCPKKKEEEEEEKDEAASLLPLLPVGGFAGDDTTRAVFLCLHAHVDTLADAPVMLVVLVPVVIFPVVPQRQIPMVLPVRKTIETPQLQYVSW